MADFREQRACIEFCFKLGKNATECYEMLKRAFGEQAMGRSQTFQWFSRFKASRTSILSAMRIFCSRNAKMKTGMGNDFFLQTCTFRRNSKLCYTRRPRSVLRWTISERM
jgi:hypothetical protein